MSDEYMIADWGLSALEKNCRSALKKTENPVADLEFVNPKEALIFMTYCDGKLFLDDKCWLEIDEPMYNSSALNLCTIAHSHPESLKNERDYRIWFLNGMSSWNLLMPPMGKYLSLTPEFFEDKKYLKVIEPVTSGRKKYVDCNETINAAFQDINDAGYDISDFVLLEPTFIRGESLYEYLAGIYFRDQGYFVSKWGPISADIFAYNLPEIRKILARYNMPSDGAFLLEFELWGLGEHIKRESSYRLEEDFVIIEAEPTPQRTSSTSSQSGIGQAFRYLKECEINMTTACAVGPKAHHVGGELRDFVGLITYDKEGQLECVYKPQPYHDPENCSEIKWIVEDLIKSIFIRSLGVENLNDLCQTTIHEKLSMKNMRIILSEVDLNEILDYITTEQLNM